MMTSQWWRYPGRMLGLMRTGCRISLIIKLASVSGCLPRRNGSMQYGPGPRLLIIGMMSLIRSVPTQMLETRPISRSLDCYGSHAFLVSAMMRVRSRLQSRAIFPTRLVFMICWGTFGNGLVQPIVKTMVELKRTAWTRPSFGLFVVAHGTQSLLGSVQRIATKLNQVCMATGWVFGLLKTNKVSRGPKIRLT